MLYLLYCWDKHNLYCTICTQDLCGYISIRKMYCLYILLKAKAHEIFSPTKFLGFKQVWPLLLQPLLDRVEWWAFQQAYTRLRRVKGISSEICWRYIVWCSQKHCLLFTMRSVLCLAMKALEQYIYQYISYDPAHIYYYPPNAVTVTI